MYPIPKIIKRKIIYIYIRNEKYLLSDVEKFILNFSILLNFSHYVLDRGRPTVVYSVRIFL